MKKRFILLLIIFLVPNLARASEPYDFITDVIRSFEQVNIARGRIWSSDSKEPVLQMKDIIVFKNEIGTAAKFVKPHTLSKDELIKDSANAFYDIYLLIIQNKEDLLNIYENTLNKPKDTKEGTFTRQISENMSTNEELWRMLLDVTAMSTHTLIDNKRTENGKLTYLKITSQEKKSVMDKLVNIFGEGIKSGPKGGQFALEGSAALLYYFLDKKGFKPSDIK